MQLNAHPMPMFGAEVTGWDFDQVADESAKETIRALVLQYKMLVLLPRKALTPQQLTDFALVFGDSLSQSTSEEWWLSTQYPMIYKVTNQPTCVAHCACEGWHCDGHYLPDPMGITVMNQVSAAGGAVEIADLSLTYESFSEAEKEKLKKIRCRNETDVSQPLVLKHPVTGQTGLYINMYAQSFDANGQALPELDADLDKRLHDYKHKLYYQGGDLIVFDNLAVVHKACPGSPDNGEEVLHRCQTSLSKTWWRKKKQVAAQAPQSKSFATAAAT